MTLKSAPYYWIECDICGISANECHEYSAWSDFGCAVDYALDSDWIIDHDIQGDVCYDCAFALNLFNEESEE